MPDALAKAMSEAFGDVHGELEIATKRGLKGLELKIEIRLEGLQGEQRSAVRLFLIGSL